MAWAPAMSGKLWKAPADDGAATTMDEPVFVPPSVPLVGTQQLSPKRCQWFSPAEPATPWSSVWTEVPTLLRLSMTSYRWLEEVKTPFFVRALDAVK